MVRQFIGITGFTKAREVRAMRAILDSACSPLALGVGVMMSYKTLRGHQTKWSTVFPPPESVKDIFLPGKRLFNVLHYADYDGVTKPEDLFYAVRCAGPNVHALQLDMIWPDVHVLLRMLKHHYPNLKIIFQLNRKAVEQMDTGPHVIWNISDSLLEYKMHNCLDYILLDMSGGEGKPLNGEVFTEYLSAFAQMFRHGVGFVVAGGLGPESLDLLDPILAEYPQVSIDAQSKLCIGGSALNPTDWENAASEYLRRAAFKYQQFSR
jgi:phosphoribosylanthranilate isomerase